MVHKTAKTVAKLGLTANHGRENKYFNPKPQFIMYPAVLKPIDK